MKKLSFLFLFLTGLLFMQQSPVSAQGYGVCEVHDTANLFTGDVCANAKAFREKGIDVYIYTTNATPRNIEEWYGIIDAFEQEHAFVGGGLVTTALVLEIDAANNYSLITVGDVLFYETPLGKTGTLAPHSQYLKDKIAQVGFTHGVTESLDRFYAVAYPAPAPVVQAPVVQNTEVYETNVDFGPLVRGIGLVLVFLAVGVGGYFLYVRVIIPVSKKRNRRHVLETQLNTLQKHVQNILLACHSDGQLGLLVGDNPQTTLLYALWASNGGKQYHDQDAALIADLGRAMEAYGRGVEIETQLKARQKPETMEALEAEVKLWEELSISLTGNSERILGMTPAEQAALMNPVTVIDTKSTNDVLLAQMDALQRVLAGAGSLRVQFIFINPSQYEGRGILGNLDAVKDKLAALERAREQAPKVLVQANELRAKLVRELAAPAETTVVKLLAPVDMLLSQAQAAFAQELWLNTTTLGEEAIESMGLFEALVAKLQRGWSAVQSVQNPTDVRIATLQELQRPILQKYNKAIKHFEAAEYVQAQGVAEDVIEAVEALVSVLALFGAALKQHNSNVTQLKNIEGRGFNISIADDEIAEAEDDVQKANHYLTAGNYGEAKRFVEELERDSARALSEVKKLVELHELNTRQLKSLSEKVAKAQVLASTVNAQWDRLTAYPQSNWMDQVDFYPQAVATLQALFDNPTDQNDLASQIERLNSLEHQRFGEAQRLLDGAFTQLKDAEAKLVAIQAQLAEVLKLEAELKQRFDSVSRDIERAVLRRDQDDSKITPEVDVWISQAKAQLAKARQEFDKKNFTTSSTLLAEANLLANRAYAEADAQAKRIDDLLIKLASVKASAQTAVTAASQKQAYQKPVVRNAATAGVVNSAVDLLKTAQSTEAKLASYEDRALESALERSIQAYDKALGEANRANTSLDADQREYDGYVKNAQSAVSVAQQAILQAERYTRDSDSGSAGSSALSRAQRALPSAPSSGDTKSELDSKRRSAEEAERYAKEAASSAQAAIREAEAERERERQRREAEARRQREAQEARERAAREAREASERAARQAREAKDRADRQAEQRRQSNSRPSGGSIGGGTHRSPSGDRSGGGRHR